MLTWQRRTRCGAADPSTVAAGPPQAPDEKPVAIDLPGTQRRSVGSTVRSDDTSGPILPARASSRTSSLYRSHYDHVGYGYIGAGPSSRTDPPGADDKQRHQRNLA